MNSRRDELSPDDDSALPLDAIMYALGELDESRMGQFEFALDRELAAGRTDSADMIVLLSKLSETAVACSAQPADSPHAVIRDSREPARVRRRVFAAGVTTLTIVCAAAFIALHSAREEPRTQDAGLVQVPSEDTVEFDEKVHMMLVWRAARDQLLESDSPIDAIRELHDLESGATSLSEFAPTVSDCRQVPDWMVAALAVDSTENPMRQPNSGVQ